MITACAELASRGNYCNYVYIKNILRAIHIFEEYFWAYSQLLSLECQSTGQSYREILSNFICEVPKLPYITQCGIRLDRKNPPCPVVKVDRRIRWLYTTTSLYFAFALVNDSRGIEIVNFTTAAALSAGTLMASAGTPYRLVCPCLKLAWSVLINLHLWQTLTDRPIQSTQTQTPADSYYRASR